MVQIHKVFDIQDKMWSKQPKIQNAGGHPSLMVLMIAGHSLCNHAQKSGPSAGHANSMSLQHQRQLIGPHIWYTKGETLDMLLHGRQSLSYSKIAENGSPNDLAPGGSSWSSRAFRWPNGTNICKSTQILDKSGYNKVREHYVNENMNSEVVKILPRAPHRSPAGSTESGSPQKSIPAYGYSEKYIS